MHVRSFETASPCETTSNSHPLPVPTPPLLRRPQDCTYLPYCTTLAAALPQVRGSVPLFWSQQLTALSPKPEIILQQFDPLYEVRMVCRTLVQHAIETLLLSALHASIHCWPVKRQRPTCTTCTNPQVPRKHGHVP